jgi:hypothetical protein
MNLKNMKMINQMNGSRYKIGISSLMIMVLMFLSGCEKFLEQDPQDSLTEQQFFKTREDANSAIVSVYDQLQDCVTKFLVWGEVRADLAIPVTRKTDFTWPYELTYQTDLAILRWGDVYQVIGGANTVITRVPAIMGLDSRLTQSETDVILGEAHF